MTWRIFSEFKWRVCLEINCYRADIGLGLLETKRWDKKVIVKYFKV